MRNFLFVVLLLIMSGCSSKKQNGDSFFANHIASGSIKGPTVGSVEDFHQNVSDRVFFAFDQYDLTEESQQVLKQQAEWLKQYPQVVFLLEGHCDSRGTDDYNLALGARRAESVRSFLVEQGLSNERIHTVSYGKSQLQVQGDDEESHSKNRVCIAKILE